MAGQAGSSFVSPAHPFFGIVHCSSKEPLGSGKRRRGPPCSADRDENEKSGLRSCLLIPTSVDKLSFEKAVPPPPRRTGRALLTWRGGWLVARGPVAQHRPFQPGILPQRVSDHKPSDLGPGDARPASRAYDGTTSS